MKYCFLITPYFYLRIEFFFPALPESPKRALMGFEILARSKSKKQAKPSKNQSASVCASVWKGVDRRSLNIFSMCRPQGPQLMHGNKDLAFAQLFPVYEVLQKSVAF